MASTSTSPASASVSLPSIHEMFPDHLIPKDDAHHHQRPRSHRGIAYPQSQSPGVHHRHRAPELDGGSHCGCSHADCPRQPHDDVKIHNIPKSSSASASSSASSSSASARRRSSASSSTAASSSSSSHTIYAFNVLRSSPTSASLQHVTSSSPHGEHYDARSSYPSPPDAYTQQRTARGGGGGGGGASLPLPPPPSSSTQHHQYRSPASTSTSTSTPNSHHGDGEDDEDAEAEAEDNENDNDNDTSNGKKHVCPTCYKRFNRPSSLRIHVNTHTGATPFRCPWPNCGREFNVNSNMRRHYRNHTTPGFSRSQGQHPSGVGAGVGATGNPPPSLSGSGSVPANGSNNNAVNQDARRKRRRVSLPIPPAPEQTQVSSSRLAVPVDGSYPPHPHSHPHQHSNGYRNEYAYAYRIPHPHFQHHQQQYPVPTIPRDAGYPSGPPSQSQFSSSQQHSHHTNAHNGHGNGHGHPHPQYTNAQSRSYPHPHPQQYMNGVMPSPPISNLSMSEEEELSSLSGSGDESDVDGIARYRIGRGGKNEGKDQMDDHEDRGEEGDHDEGELMQYDEHGYRTGSLAQSLARVNVHRTHPYSRTQYHRDHRDHHHNNNREHGQERDEYEYPNRSMRGVGASEQRQRPLTPGSSFHSSSPSPSISPSPPPPSERHAVSSERQQARGEGQAGQNQNLKYSASMPYVRSLVDMKVSTTLRPAFAGGAAGGVSSTSGDREREGGW